MWERKLSPFLLNINLPTTFEPLSVHLHIGLVALAAIRTLVGSLCKPHLACSKQQQQQCANLSKSAHEDCALQCARL
uniref:Uncharacterized protein n=1 Tax=Pararge aegeria TaxID=116150 RepID=S4NWV7_9NEOP